MALLALWSIGSVTTRAGPQKFAAPAQNAPQRPGPNFYDVATSPEVRHIVEWIASSNDNGGLEFVIVDKRAAQVYLFRKNMAMIATSPVLLGGARGDDTVLGIGDRPLEQILPEERTTPAGRFLGESGTNARGEDVVWVDYDAAVSMHRVLTTHPGERRLERLATPTADDNRISYGCINVPVAFFETHIRPMFMRGRAIIYVLPETRNLDEIFAIQAGNFSSDGA